MEEAEVMALYSKMDAKGKEEFLSFARELIQEQIVEEVIEELLNPIHVVAISSIVIKPDRYCC